MRASAAITFGLATAVLGGLVYQLLPDREVAGGITGTSSHATDRASEPVPVAPTPTPAWLDPQYILPTSAIASGDLPEPFESGASRFWKVPRNLVPLYEEAARDYRIPVRYLAANGSWESLFSSTKMGDSNRSCGIHQFHHFRVRNGRRDWTVWGFSSLEECQDPRANIRMTAKIWRARIDNEDPNARCNGLLSCAIRLHKGHGAVGYMHTVMGAADRLYR